ncbi:MAG: AsnC family transcriptional regulator [Rhodospirillales bacterium]|nr:AsnC family transcriptional regulator [Rhodospirillales bacterium]MCW8861570.1 AsnC family transcriptional regulator [Rhodospirillales bacterium]MCW8951847.1 AsnC family transcriptional regulator [Rhodospirillales bacterium]MCW8971071.1 AsnC family transcriptional regulator [Rhodospirillales bacterium]MCW9001933.1 AsnC family transcriptional regulator [Rhodospirillales bacterium]
MSKHVETDKLDEVDRRIVVATQKGLPLVAQPYHAVAEELGLDAAEVMKRLQRMEADGVIRRIGVVPNHYALGYRFNGMTVWDVEDSAARELGARVGALDCVSHCYLRPRHMPDWPYNLFAMVHGRDREAAEQDVAKIAEVLGDRCRDHQVLFSTRILKKTGLRLSA